MSYSTELTTTISFFRETYNNKWQVTERLEKVKKIIEEQKQELMNLAIMTEPQKFFQCDEDCDIFDEIKRRVNDAFECIDEYITEEYKLIILLDEWEKCHDKEGFAIPCPDEHFEKSYLDGDYIQHKE